ncbi:hypothetical protein N7474_001691 [Penicillium riverlandense]|uniref:uncharacterized protein n=1 Tax=Penicillium riverlandense TaxID=1903569 RepID=UPI002548ADDA|nr:uncharacterized protein N7474_001691 [Penicillium riverlandense]KAJ5833380.1 hypothetical protein N7474_001691 [Penicillium riverlandense]
MAAYEPDPSLQLHYTTPAAEWAQALPVGNGRFGAMIHGRTDTELLSLNEDSVWYGGPQDRTPRNALENLPRLRQFIRNGLHREVEKLMTTAFYGAPTSMRHYEPLGTCHIDFDYGDVNQEVTNYRRVLDLGNATQSISYQVAAQGGNSSPINVKREIIASYPDQAMLMRITSGRKIRLVLRLARSNEVEHQTNDFVDTNRAIDNTIVLHATPGGRGSNPLCLALGVVCDDDGSIEVCGNSLIVNSASCKVALGAQTRYRCKNVEAEAMNNVLSILCKSWEAALSAHVEDYRSLFGRMSLRMSPDANNVPTDKRILDHHDPGLFALYHNYGRYLLISSSRDGYKPLPANLQGIWNNSFTPPWGSKYTININTQMNYWPAPVCGLAECMIPLVELLERMAERGRKTAQVMYGCRGWCCHHNTDIWADTDPQDRWLPATVWPFGGVWICNDVVQLLHYHYDPTLHQRLRSILRGAVEFLLDFLIPSDCGQYLVTNPSLSPENSYIDSSGEAGIFCEGSVMDIDLVRTAFRLYVWSEETLRTPAAESDILSKVRDALGRLLQPIISPAGRIQEWGLRDYGELEPGHRHTSHLFGLYPGDSLRNDPALLDAARNVLAHRAAHGGGHTGWSRAWLINLHAHLPDPDGCGQHLHNLLTTSTLPNMLDNHPPFQIDGNFGGCVGILECLVQSHFQFEDNDTVYVTLLPSLPPDWKQGRVEDVCVRRGWSVSFQWKEGKIVNPINLRASAAALQECKNFCTRWHGGSS